MENRVVFASGRDGEFDPELGFERLALFTVSSDGGDAERLTSGPYDHQPDWSPDGSKVVFVREFYDRTIRQEVFQELWVMDVESKNEERLLRLTARPDDDELSSPKAQGRSKRRPRTSPDARGGVASPYWTASPIKGVKVFLQVDVYANAYPSPYYWPSAASVAKFSPDVVTAS
jgi:dipeptidyl aminopeptidase/acylaminoacyl peptidase